ncbi:PP2C family protein-serine/threonine phosphatase [Nocardioides sp. KR10-350]|uniref:PP2C family protein-serine/threonine phosphatase n=1 Tax=Nocardioides cheoyonin TaxID=3156615 RepID=UPI0032B44000
MSTQAHSALVARLRRPNLLRRRLRGAETRTLLALGVLTVLCTVLASMHEEWIEWFPLASLTVPLLLGSLLLGPRTLPWFVVFVMAMLVLATSRQNTVSDVDAAAVGVYFLLGLIVLLVSFRRTRLGVAGFRGESMFVDLRDRILSQGGMPDLPPQWHAESTLASASGTRFAGDFVVAVRPAPARLEVAVVDVSGKGEQAGTRALQLSGAFGGLLGALPAADFLVAANEYLLRQEWEEGFATAVHLSVDLVSGAYEVRTAGHPPALLRHPDGQWDVASGNGPVLGLIEGAEFSGAAGVLGHGDSLMLYTDGMVEAPGRDIELGTQHLVTEAERLFATGSDRLSRRLVERLGSKDDDRALVVVRHS